MEEKSPAVAAERRQSGEEVDRPGMTNGDQEAAVQKEEGKSPVTVGPTGCHRHHAHGVTVTALTGWCHAGVTRHRHQSVVMSIAHLSPPSLGGVMLGSLVTVISR